MTERHSFEDLLFPLTALVQKPVTVALTLVFFILQFIVVVAWVVGAVVGGVTRYRGGNAQEVFREAEKYGVDTFWLYSGAMLTWLLWLVEKLYHYFAAHQIAGFICFMFLGIVILYPLVRVVMEAKLQELLLCPLHGLIALPKRILAHWQIVLSCALAMAIMIPVLIVLVSFLIFVVLLAVNTLPEDTSLLQAWQASTPVALKILISAFAGFWEFLCFLPGFAMRNPGIAIGSLVTVLLAVLADPSFVFDDP